MAISVDESNGIIIFDATNQEVEGQNTIEGILFYGTAAGASQITDSAGKVLARVNLTAEILTLYMPINRTVRGIKAGTIATNQSVIIYLKKN